jgi:hypothetical protein
VRTDFILPTSSASHADRRLGTSEVSLLLGGDGSVNADGWARCPCPAHAGTGNNLSLRITRDGRLLVRCFSVGCDPDAIRAAIDKLLGTTFSDPWAGVGVGVLGPRPAHLGGVVEATEAAGEAVPIEFPAPTPIEPDRVQPKPRGVPWVVGIKEPKPELTPAEKRRETREKLDRIWSATTKITVGSLAWRYLTWTRGLELGRIPPTLRFHPGLYHWRSGGFGPAMVALVADYVGKPVALHRTWIDPRTTDKAFAPESRLALGPCGGCAVWLAGDQYAEQLLVGEGIETVLSFALLASVDMECSGPVAVWAALSSSGLMTLKVPLRFRKIVVAADNDESSTGMVAAEALVTRLRQRRDVSVKIMLPKRVGSDWNDVLLDQRTRAASINNSDNQGDAL